MVNLVMSYIIIILHIFVWVNQLNYHYQINKIIELDIDLAQFTLDNQPPVIISNYISNIKYARTMVNANKFGPINLKYMTNIDIFDLCRNPRT